MHQLSHSHTGDDSIIMAGVKVRPVNIDSSQYLNHYHDDTVNDGIMSAKPVNIDSSQSFKLSPSSVMGSDYNFITRLHDVQSMSTPIITRQQNIIPLPIHDHTCKDPSSIESDFLHYQSSNGSNTTGKTTAINDVASCNSSSVHGKHTPSHSSVVSSRNVGVNPSPSSNGGKNPSLHSVPSSSVVVHQRLLLWATPEDDILGSCSGSVEEKSSTGE